MVKRTWIDETVTVNTSADQLLALLKDVDGWPSWTPGLRTIKRRDRSAINVGTRFQMMIEPGIPIGCEMYAYDADRLEWGGGIGSSIVRHSLEVKAEGDKRCQLRHLEYAVGVLAILAMPIEKRIAAYDHRWTKTIVARFA